MVIRMKTTAIIVGAGQSTRMGMTVSKQLIKLCGKETILHTLTAFQQAETVSEIIVVCRKQDKAIIQSLAETNNITKLKALTEGGNTRQQSVINGLQLVDSDTDYIAIHDGARPLVSVEKINQVIRDAYQYGSATLGVSVKDTIKIVDNNHFIQNTPDRSTLMAVHTPQVFEKITYTLAVQKALSEHKDYTDDCQLIETMGKKVFITTDFPTNIKLTTPEDILIAETFLNGQ